MLRRDLRFVPEKHTLDRATTKRLAFMAVLGCTSLLGLLTGAKHIYLAVTLDSAVEIVTLAPENEIWKIRPASEGGREFSNQGLEINKIQAELFDIPSPEEILLAPPPASF